MLTSANLLNNQIYQCVKIKFQRYHCSIVKSNNSSKYHVSYLYNYEFSRTREFQIATGVILVLQSAVISSKKNLYQTLSESQFVRTKQHSLRNIFYNIRQRISAWQSPRKIILFLFIRLSVFDLCIFYVFYTFSEVSTRPSLRTGRYKISLHILSTCRRRYTKYEIPFKIKHHKSRIFLKTLRLTIDVLKEMKQTVE